MCVFWGFLGPDPTSYGTAIEETHVIHSKSLKFNLYYNNYERSDPFTYSLLQSQHI